MLSDVYRWFTQGFDTADLEKAKRLLEDLVHRGYSEGDASQRADVGTFVFHWSCNYQGAGGSSGEPQLDRAVVSTDSDAFNWIMGCFVASARSAALFLDTFDESAATFKFDLQYLLDCIMAPKLISNTIRYPRD